MENVVMMRETAESLADFSRDELGDNLRVVTRYSRDVHDPIYIREDIPEQMQLDQEARSMFRHPLVRMQRGVWELSRHHPILDDPGVAIYSYGAITVVQFPITEEEGIIIALDGNGSLPEGFVTRCESIVYGAD